MEYKKIVNGLEVNAFYSDESVEKIFLPLLRELTRLQREKGRRILVMLAAPPAAGKSTLVSFLQDLSVSRADVTPVTAIGMDGFHHYQDYLLSHYVALDGVRRPMVEVKGSPISFDLEKLRDRIARVREGGPQPWPLYDRTLHNPVEGAILVEGDIVLLEGNYLLLESDGWRELRAYADYTIRITVDEEDVRDRLTERKARSGMPLAQARAFVERSDMANVRLCLQATGDADLKLRMLKDGTYVREEHTVFDGSWLLPLSRQFEKEETARKVVLRLSTLQKTELDYPLYLPGGETWQERRLAERMLRSRIYNILSIRGGLRLDVLYDADDHVLAEIVRESMEAFRPGEGRHTGVVKIVNVINRIAGLLGEEPFSIGTRDIRSCELLAGPERQSSGPIAEVLRAQAAEAGHKNLIGIDIGGTDIKLAASVGGKLCLIKEYDWNPAESPDAEGICGPILLLIRLMRARMAAELCPSAAKVRGLLDAVMPVSASDEAMREAVTQAEELLGEALPVLDGVGVSFPDVVIHDTIIGGETPKTQGMRSNSTVSYEEAFAEIGRLRERILLLCRPGGSCRMTNDGNIAAYTAAMEQAAAGADPSIACGVVAHALGTGFGTGWIDSSGKIPQMPLEAYDLLLNMADEESDHIDPADLRSSCSENLGLPGSNAYVSQQAAFRLGLRFAPELMRDHVAEKEGLLKIRTVPADMRKACLENLMRYAQSGHEGACRIFRSIGFYMGQTMREMEYVLGNTGDERCMFGRFVKHEACFRLISEGALLAGCTVRLLLADDELANSSLMRQLAARTDVTVAQFAQAIGAIYFACS